MFDRDVRNLTSWLSGAGLVAALALAYSNALYGSFQFDDYNVIVDNGAVHTLNAWWHSMPGIRPLLKLSYTVNWIAAPSAAGFVAFNIACHALNSVLVLMLCDKLCRNWLVPAPRAALAALLATLIFALHPAQTEAVTYICGRSVALMSLFYLAALVAGCSEIKAWRQIASPLLFSLALLTKETAWTLPFALLLVNSARGVPLARAVRQLWPHWLALVGVGGVLLVSDGYLQMLGHIQTLRAPLSNLALQVNGVFYLLTQPLLLLRIDIDPDLPQAILFDGWWWLRLVSLLLLLAVGIQWRRSWTGFAVLWFALQLLPTNSLWPRNDIANDRQLYLALIGPALLLARAIVSWPQRIAVPAAGLLVFGLGVATAIRNNDYRDEISLWQATARLSPHKARVWNNLGYAYQLAGRQEDARNAYLYAQILDPGNERARINNLLLPDAATPAARE